MVARLVVREGGDQGRVIHDRPVTLDRNTRVWVPIQPTHSDEGLGESGRVSLVEYVATVKPMAAALLFAVTWCVVAWRVGVEWGLRGSAAVLLLMPIYLGAAIILIDRVGLLMRAFRSWRRSGTRDGFGSILRGERQRVVQAVARAL